LINAYVDGRRPIKRSAAHKEIPMPKEAPETLFSAPAAARKGGQESG